MVRRESLNIPENPTGTQRIKNILIKLQSGSKEARRSSELYSEADFSAILGRPKARVQQKLKLTTTKSDVKI